MKKIIAMLLSVCLVLAFAACSQKEEPSSEPEETTPASEETVEPTDSEDGKEEEWDWEEGITGEKMTITNEDGFDQAGYVEIPTEKLGRYYFKANEASKNGFNHFIRNPINRKKIVIIKNTPLAKNIFASYAQ